MRLLTLLFWLLAPGSLLQAAAGAPNIIIHFIDDLGYGDLGYGDLGYGDLGYGDLGPFGAVKQMTPHLDRMAREGMKLTTTSDQTQTARVSRC
jgi:hypothetical protein